MGGLSLWERFGRDVHSADHSGALARVEIGVVGGVGLVEDRTVSSGSCRFEDSRYVSVCHFLSLRK
jgi:hypothetical protein